VLLLLALASCAGAPVKEEALTFDSVVTASWYGEEFHGRPTSSGQAYDMHAKTAAHRTLPFGTQVKVTSLESGRSAIVTVNDRGPFKEERGIDLSYAAAMDIGLVGSGTAQVKLDVVGRDPSYIKSVGYDKYLRGPLTVQVASLADAENAERLRTALSRSYKGVYVSAAYVENNKYYRVRVGKFTETEEASATAKRLADEGYDVLVTRYTERI
jgi:rare lipoprotein A